MKNKLSLIVLFTVLILASCEKNNPTSPSETTYYGQTQSVGQGYAKSWVKLDGNSNPTSVGITFSESVLTSLGTTGGETVLMLPAEASKTVFNNVALDWNPNGHPPTGIYDLPHFDVHFYMIDQNERNQITGAASDSANMYMAPGSGYLAQDYFLAPGFGVPMMGAHAIDTTSGEFHGQTFNYTLIYGYYKGQMIFIEPMITKAYFESKPNATHDLKLPQYYSKAGYYPTKWSVSYDATAKEYTVAMTNMVYRSSH